jgi:hypothetical protein
MFRGVLWRSQSRVEDECRYPEQKPSLCLPGENGSGYRLECSTDLTNWMPLCTIVVTDGSMHFVDPDADGHAHRFYRGLPEANVDLDD